MSARGRLYAASLARYFNEANISGLRVWTSEKKRTKQTAQDIKAPKEHIAALNELDAVCISFYSLNIVLSNRKNIKLPLFNKKYILSCS